MRYQLEIPLHSFAPITLTGHTLILNLVAEISCISIILTRCCPLKARIWHTFATFQPAAGERPKVVQEILGHSSIKTTMDTYSHVIPGMQEEAAGRLQRLLFGPTPVTFPSADENARRNDEKRQQKIPRLQGN
jgi:hypothetical protein